MSVTFESEADDVAVLAGTAVYHEGMLIDDRHILMFGISLINTQYQETKLQVNAELSTAACLIAAIYRNATHQGVMLELISGVAQKMAEWKESGG